MKIETSKGKSPYAKYAKAPYPHSAAYQTWNAALGDAGAGYGSPNYMRADTAFRIQFGVRRAPSNYGQVFVEDNDDE